LIDTCTLKSVRDFHLFSKKNKNGKNYDDFSCVSYT